MVSLHIQYSAISNESKHFLVHFLVLFARLWQAHVYMGRRRRLSQSSWGRLQRSLQWCHNSDIQIPWHIPDSFFEFPWYFQPVNNYSLWFWRSRDFFPQHLVFPDISILIGFSWLFRHFPDHFVYSLIQDFPDFPILRERQDGWMYFVWEFSWEYIQKKSCFGSVWPKTGDAIPNGKKITSLAVFLFQFYFWTKLRFWGWKINSRLIWTFLILKIVI